MTANRPSASVIKLYGYVINDPVNFIDPTGLLPPDNVPPNVSMRVNIEQARDMSPGEFYEAVRNNGPWDYKQQGSQYEEFGNYNFGATGAATGWFPGNILNRGAGWAQGRAGTSDPAWGEFWDWPTTTNFGDDPWDQYWINEGIRDYENGLFDFYEVNGLMCTN